MGNSSKPTQQQLMNYLQQRHASPNPPPTPEQIRRELSWNMLHPSINSRG